jgi:hypothetical protein
MSASSGPPAYAWDWVSRQRLVWREVRSRLARAGEPLGRRYSLVSAKPDVMPLLRADYPVDAVVADTVRTVVAEQVFLGRIDRPFASLGITNAPRGLRWWWQELTGEQVGAPPPVPAGDPAKVEPTQLELEDVLRGYGD